MASGKAHCWAMWRMAVLVVIMQYAVQYKHCGRDCGSPYIVGLRIEYEFCALQLHVYM